MYIKHARPLGAHNKAQFNNLSHCKASPETKELFSFNVWNIPTGYIKQIFAPFEPKRSLSSPVAVPSAMVLFCLYERNFTCKMALYWPSNHGKLLM